VLRPVARLLNVWQYHFALIDLKLEISIACAVSSGSTGNTFFILDSFRVCLQLGFLPAAEFCR
jgi:hypothetical protein